MGSWNPHPQVAKYEGLVVHHAPLAKMVPWILAVIEQESSGNPAAVGAAGEIGLMQLQPKYHAPGGNAQALYDPATNIRIGSQYLYEMLNRFWRMDYALVAYNMGPTALASILNSGGRPNMAYADAVRNKAVNHYYGDVDDYFVADWPVGGGTGPATPSEPGPAVPGGGDKSKLYLLIAILAGGVLLALIVD